MKTLIALALAAFATSANACDTFTSELWDKGVRTAVYTPGSLVITDHGKVAEYRVVSAGTGIPYMAAISETDDSKGLALREYEGVLLVDMEVFEPTCD